MSRLRKLPVSEFVFACSCLAILFAYGFAVGHYRVFPFGALRVVERAASRITAPSPRPDFTAAARYAGDGVTVLRHDRVTGGLTLLSGAFAGRQEVRLVRLDGSVVHRWSADRTAFFPPSEDVPTYMRPKSGWSGAVHGALVLPNGSLVFNMTNLGTVTVDRCGRTQWTLRRPTHHSVSRAADGSLWIPAARYVQSDSATPRLYAPYVEDTILRVSLDGRVLSELSIPDVLARNALDGLLLWRRGTADITRLNDVDVLSAADAARFPAFAAGDLLVSLRMPHLVFVLDPDTLDIKWYQAGPWLGQHDPDFGRRGGILVFNNNDDGTLDGARDGGSSIMEVDPATRRITVRYGGRPDQPLFSEEWGKLQEVGDHLLVTETGAGRVFEVDAGGEVVWELINRHDGDLVGLITEATRYPEAYFTVKEWACR